MKTSNLLKPGWIWLLLLSLPAFAQPGPGSFPNNPQYVDAAEMADGQRPDFLIPDAFTPDGDGLNEYLAVYARGFERFEFAIYARNGAKVFESMQEGHFWDGRINGSEAPVGVYVYRAIGYTAENVYYAQEGWIMLVR
jgi:gliding motility-associated-like protein